MLHKGESVTLHKGVLILTKAHHIQLNGTTGLFQVAVVTCIIMCTMACAEHICWACIMLQDHVQYNTNMITGGVNGAVLPVWNATAMQPEKSFNSCVLAATSSVKHNYWSAIYTGGIAL